MKSKSNRASKDQEDKNFQDVSVYIEHTMLVNKRKKAFSKVFFVLLVLMALFLMAFSVFAYFDTKNAGRDDIEECSMNL